jgi:hypothetical protein
LVTVAEGCYRLNFHPFTTSREHSVARQCENNSRCCNSPRPAIFSICNAQDSGLRCGIRPPVPRQKIWSLSHEKILVVTRTGFSCSCSYSICAHGDILTGWGHARDGVCVGNTSCFGTAESEFNFSNGDSVAITAGSVVETPEPSTGSTAILGAFALTAVALGRRYTRAR